MNIKYIYLTILMMPLGIIGMEEDKSNDKNKLNEQLCDEVINADIAQIESLLKKGANPNFENGIPVLLMAILVRNLEIIKLLIKFGANLNFKGVAMNASFLAIAATLKRSEIVKLFIASGADIVNDIILKNDLNEGKIDPEIKKIIDDEIDLRNRLFKAIESGDYQVVKNLILKVAPIKELRKKVLLVTTNIYGDNILHAAVIAKNSKDSKKIVEFIFSIAPDLVQQKNKMGQSPIDLAANNPDVLKIFMFKNQKGK